MSYAGHALMENRNGLAVNGGVTPTTGRADHPHPQKSERQIRVCEKKLPNF